MAFFLTEQRFFQALAPNDGIFSVTLADWPKGGRKTLLKGL